MMMWKIRIVIIIFCWYGAATSGFAQDIDTKESLPQEPDKKANLNREMTLEREYDPTVQDAAKVNTQPAAREIKIVKRPIVYSDYAVPIQPAKELNILPAETLMTDVGHNQRNGYLHFGGGMLMNFCGDFGYHLLDTEVDNLNIYFSHRSMNGDVKFANDNYPKRKAKINDNIGGLNFEHRFDEATLQIGGDFGHSAFNYYGAPTNHYPYSYFPTSALMFSPAPLTMDDSTNQANQYINVRAGIYSTILESVGYRAMIDYTNFNQKYALSKNQKGLIENNLGIDLGLNSPVKDGKYFGLNIKMNMLGYTPPQGISGIDSTSFDNRFEITFNPYFKIERETWNLLLGLNVMAIAPDSLRSVFASPNISFETPFGNRNVFYTKLGGGIQSNTMAELSRTNRYITPRFTADPSRTWADLKLGVRSGASSGFWFDVFAGYKYTDADLFFNPSQDAWIDGGFNNLSTYYQPNSQALRIGATFKYDYRQSDFYLKGVYDHYILTHFHTWKNDRINPIESSHDIASIDIETYGRPSLVVNAGANVRPLKPLTLSLDYCVMAGMYVYLNGKNEAMNAINDLRFRASWKFSNSFSLYAQFNNVLFQQNELYYGYPLQPFTAMGGFNLNF